MQTSLYPIDINPHSLHLLKLDFIELKLINITSNINKGIKTTKSKTFPSKLIKKLIPKIGTIINRIKV